jgi:hypothetical protein
VRKLVGVRKRGGKSLRKTTAHFNESYFISSNHPEMSRRIFLYRHNLTHIQPFHGYKTSMNFMPDRKVVDEAHSKVFAAPRKL